MHDHHDYDALYRAPDEDGPPWQLDRPQPAFVDTVNRVEPGTTALECGCGAGDLAVVLAERGARVTDFDGSEPAVARVRQLATEHGVTIDAVVLDATDVTATGGPFDLVTDSGLLHSLDDNAQEEYVHGLASVTRSGSEVVILAADPETGRSFGVTAERLEALFDRSGWSVTISDAPVETRFGWSLAGRLLHARRR